MDWCGTGGGSLALAELIDEHGPAAVADFQSVYGLRLADVLFEQSPREVLALVEGLLARGDSGLLVARYAGGEEWREFVGWGRDRHLLVDLIDVYVQAHTAENKKPWTYPRPGAKQKQAAGTPFMALVPRRPMGGS